MLDVLIMPNHTRTSPRIRRRHGRQTLAELLRGASWVARQWEAARGLLRGRAPKDAVRWQRQIRREWTQGR